MAPVAPVGNPYMELSHIAKLPSYQLPVYVVDKECSYKVKWVTNW